MYIFNLLLYIFVPTKVYINLERPNNLIIHTGITFINNDKEVRYDFRAFNDNDNYITTDESRKNITLMFPKVANIVKYKGILDEIDVISKKDIFWGLSNYTLDEIDILERKLNKNYILGLYDCRHYVNALSLLTLNKKIPIWNLDKL